MERTTNDGAIGQSGSRDRRWWEKEKKEAGWQGGPGGGDEVATLLVLEPFVSFFVFFCRFFAVGLARLNGSTDWAGIGDGLLFPK